VCTTNVIKGFSAFATTPHSGLTPTSTIQADASWQPLLRAVAAAYRSVLGSDLVGVYLRGSLPRGLFIPGVSDLDTFCLVLSNASSSSSSSTGGGGGEGRSADAAAAVSAALAPALEREQPRLGFVKVSD
jgi:hypothetical protein